MTDPTVAAREAEAQAARARLQQTLGALKDRVSPPNVAHRAVETAKTKALGVVEDGSETVKKHPFAAGAVVAALGVLLARKPLWRLVRRERMPAEKS